MRFEWSVFMKHLSVLKIGGQGEAYSHVHEIEIDVSDMKQYLQDFLASIQRAAKDRSTDPFWMIRSSIFDIS